MAFRLRSHVLQNGFKTLHRDRPSRVREFIQRIQNFEMPERFKGTLVEKWAMFWRQLFRDYKDVAVDVCKEFKERPVKSFFYVSLLGSGIFMSKHNPDEVSFLDALYNSRSDIIMTGESIRNQESLRHVQWLNDCYAEGIVRRLSLGVVSFIWLDNYSQSLALYKAICPYLKPRYLTFHERIVDVGFLDTWWVLKKKMVDYDVNENEFNQAKPVPA